MEAICSSKTLAPPARLQSVISENHSVCLHSRENRRKPNQWAVGGNPFITNIDVVKVFWKVLLALHLMYEYKRFCQRKVPFNLTCLKCFYPLVSKRCLLKGAASLLPAFFG